MKKICSLIFALCLSNFLAAQTAPVPSSEIYQKIKKLDVLASVLYIAAHPDDENTLMLTYLSREKLTRTGYLSLTRGDGGQNLIGTEQGYNIGVIRTQELLAARKIDGAEQFFSRAYDFGFSKTKDETLEFWNEEKILSDVVWVIRKYQPDVIITRFPPDPRAGHGHHQSSAVLAEKAFHLSADKNSFAEQLAYVKPWQAKRIVWNTYSPGFSNQAPKDENASFIPVELGLYNPLMGRSYTEIAAESRSQHKSQGFGSTAVRDARIEYLIHKGGQVAAKSMFDGIDTTWQRVPGSQAAASMVRKIIKEYKIESPQQSVPDLVRLYKELQKLDASDIYVSAKSEEIRQIIKDCLGLWFESTGTEYASSPGEAIDINTSVVKQADFPVTLKAIQWKPSGKDSVLNTNLNLNEAVRVSSRISLPGTIRITQPYWLEKPMQKGSFDVSDPRLIGQPESIPEIFTSYIFEIAGEQFEYHKPLVFKQNDPIDGEVYRPFEIRPAVMVNFDEPVYLFTDQTSKAVKLTIIAGKSDIHGTVSLQLPKGWKSVPESVSFDIEEKNDEKQVVFNLLPPGQTDEQVIRALIKIDHNNAETAHSVRTISYKHIPRQTLFPVAETKAARVEVRTLAKKVGYIAGAGDDIPKALKQMGCQVIDVSTSNPDTDLSGLDAIVLGVRAYNTDERLPFFQHKLMDYVKNGGTLLVQYNTAFGMNVKNPGPYPFTIGRDRVSEEDAEIRFLIPEHNLLNHPNKITQADFNNWIQERGLYFAAEWSPEYVALLSANDTGEAPKNGMLIHAKYGKGNFVYTGLSFFRELPAGVTGAYRLFANIISAGK